MNFESCGGGDFACVVGDDAAVISFVLGESFRDVKSEGVNFLRHLEVF
jgi:hypothetical protein